MGPPPGSGKRKESPKIRNLRPYIIGRVWGPHPAAADQTRRKEKGKPKNQKFEALYNRGWEAKNQKKRKEKGKPKNQKFEALYNREGLGPPPGSSGPKEKEREKGKPKNQKFEALYNRGRAATNQKKRKEKGKPKNQKFEALYNREGLGPPPGSSGPKEKERERKAPKSEI